MKRRVSAYLIIVVLLVSLTVILSFKWLRDDKRGTNIQLNGLPQDNRTNAPQNSRNMTQADICVSQWQQDLLTMEETLRCIEEYMENVST